MQEDIRLAGQLRRITRQRGVLDERERALVVQLRDEYGWSWNRLAPLLGLTRPGVQKRYADLMEGSPEANLTETSQQEISPR